MRRSERNLADPDLGMLTHHVTAALQRTLATALAGHGDRQIGPRHRAILACLDGVGSRAVDVARQAGQHKQVVGTLVDELEQLGYVQRQPDPADRRAKLIVPTQLGLQQTARTDAAMARIEHAIAASLGDQHYRDFKQAFRQVAEILSQLQLTPTPREGRDDTRRADKAAMDRWARHPGSTPRSV